MPMRVLIRLDCIRAMLVLVSASIVFLLVGKASAQEAATLALKFRQGQRLHYIYEEKSAYTPPQKFVGADGWTLETRVEYTLKINSITEDHAAYAKFTFNRITVTRDGKQIADLTVFPRKASAISVTIEPNGETTFYRHVYLTFNRGEQLEFRISEGGGPLATNTATDAKKEKYILAADLDETEGVIKIGVPPTLEITDPDYEKLVEFKIDLTPHKLFSLMQMPTVPLAKGQTFSIPIKYLGQEQLTYQGKGSEGGFQGDKAEISIAAWNDEASGSKALQPELTGTIHVLIDSFGRLAFAHGETTTHVLIPGIGVQKLETTMDLKLKK